MPGSWNPVDFPKLNPNNHRITSPTSNRYNCIAWAADVKTRWWWPGFQYYYWPPGVPQEETIHAFLAAFATIDYRECRNGLLELGYEKVALFANNHKGYHVPSHAAKQLGNGWWTSKLGPLEDIEHRRAEDIEGPAYGSVVRFMKRGKVA